MKNLALFGGTPVRTKPFRSIPAVDEEEIAAVTQSMREGLLSRFVGSDIPGTRELLKKPSKELLHIEGSHSFLGGPNVRKFEAEWAKLHEVEFAITMNSATSAATAVLMSLDVGAGSEVITTPFSFTATATSIVLANAIPVFADIDPETFCLDPDSVERAITPQTKCIMPVHWCGNAGDFEKLLKIAQKYNIPVVEDAAQAPATRYKGKFLGGHGAAGTFSYSEPKNMTTGEGGMVITNRADIAEKCRLIRNHGEAIPSMSDSDDYIANSLGYNFRMTEATAAMGWVQVSKLPKLNKIRNENYSYLREKLEKVVDKNLLPQRIPHPETYAAYTAAFRWDTNKTGITRDTVALALRKEGIPVAVGVGRLMSDHPMFQKKLAFGKQGCPFTCHLYEGKVNYDPKLLPESKQLHDNEYLGFFLMGQPNTSEDMNDIVAAFEKIMANLPALKKYSEENYGKPIPYDRGRG
jgi:perosamine synthetase